MADKNTCKFKNKNETLLANASHSIGKIILENGTKIHSINGPPQCGLYTLGQLSKLYVLIRLEETNKNKSQEILSLILFGDNLFFNPFPACFYHPTWGYGQYKCSHYFFSDYIFQAYFFFYFHRTNNS